MGIETALYTGVSGLDAMSQQLSVIGNNISNSNTVGFKGGATEFANLLSTSLGGTSSTQSGNGVQVETIGTDFSQGTLQSTTNPLDLAIQGAGFFLVNDTTGATYYTRAGQFSVDKNGNIVNPNGDYLQGKAVISQAVTSATGVTTPATFGAQGDINISQIGYGAPTSTTKATIFANLQPTTGQNPISSQTFDITSTNNTLIIAASAVTGIASTHASGLISVVLTKNSYTGSALAAQVQTQVNAALKAVHASTYAAAYTSGTAVSVTYNKATFASSGAVQYEFTINNIGANAPVEFDWSSANSTATNMLGFSAINNQASIPPVPDSGSVSILNGKSAESDFQVAGFDPNNPGSNTFSTAMTVYDSIGKSHLVSVYFQNLGASKSPAVGETGDQWIWTAVIPSSDSQNGETQIASQGILNFTNSGALYNVTGPTLNSFNFAGSVVQNQQITFDFGDSTEWLVNGGSGTTGTTETGSTSSIVNQYQNGYASGSLQTYSVSQTGIITGTFTNGQTQDIAQLVMARFNAPDQLTNAGNNLYTQSAGSGQPIPGVAQAAGFGSIFSESLEESNVDLSSEFVNMITCQSAYQADAKVISTAQELFTALQNAKQ